jgi:alkanesulfonate monooxygenase SsuD/methylene tetrahydromethanopterin reductase-like flavin-dependent oxidoreductase (luciferase family)
MMDHLLLGPLDRPEPVAECFSVVAALAAATQRIELGTLVACVSFRNAGLLAKIAVTIDEISGGRLIVGLGAGWHEPEYRAFGYPFDHLASRFGEAIQVISSLLKTGKADFAGRYDHFENCPLNPPPRPGGPPIMVAASGERMLRLTAQYADWWNGAWYAQPNQAVARLAEIDQACQAAGRDPATLVRTCGVRFGPPTSESPTAIADLLRGFAALGFAHAQIRPATIDQRSIEAIGQALEILDRG